MSIVNIRKKNVSKGILIVFEGIDGSGKSTHAKILFDDLTADGFDAVILKEPTSGKWGEKIREIAKFGRGGISPKEELDYFMNDRREDVELNITPCLNAKKIVIMDRYYISTMAYQGVVGFDPEETRKINEDFAPTPDIVFLLDIEPKVAVSRIMKERGGIYPGFEKEEYLSKVRTIFNSIHMPGLITINTNAEIDSVSDKIISEVDNVLKKYEEKNQD